MILYSLPNCPLCKVTKVKMQKANIAFEECQDEEVLKQKNIDRLPVLEKDNGELLEFKEILNYISEVAD